MDVEILSDRRGPIVELRLWAGDFELLARGGRLTIELAGDEKIAFVRDDRPEAAEAAKAELRPSYVLRLPAGVLDIVGGLGGRFVTNFEDAPFVVGVVSMQQRPRVRRRQRAPGLFAERRDQGALD